ncbi:MAG: hypothetical protein WCR69_00575 [Sulfuricurvum sp.]
MFYVIKKNDTKPLPSIVGFEVDKYIATRNSTSVIVEFKHENKPIRRWVDKSEIILLTDDKEFFLQTLEKFKLLHKDEQSLIDQAKHELDMSVENSNNKLNSAIEEFQKQKFEGEYPCILKRL